MRVSFSLAVLLPLSLLAVGALPLRAQVRDQNETAPVAAAPDKAPAAAERNALRRAQNEVRLRAMMNDFGIEAATSQDALIAYLAEDEAGKGAVRVAARRLMMAVRDGAAPERMRKLIAVYKAALDADKERRRASQSSLDAKIGFSLSPRLEATLWLLGVLGEGQSGLSPNALAPRAPKNVPGDALRDGDALRETGARRGGTVRGIVTQKAEGWIEVQGDKGAKERYLPFWMDDENRAVLTGNAPTAGAPLDKDAAARSNRTVLETLARVQIGQRVRLEWAWSGRKRVVALDILPPEDAPPQGDDALKNGGEAPPLYAVPAVPDAGQ